MTNSKKKGNRFERTVGLWFSVWTGYKFERNRAGSGAWHSNKDSTSDITCTDARHAHRCKISIECKSYKDIRFEHVILGNKNCDILRFWKQAKTDADRGGKIPFLCMRYNSMPSSEFFFVMGSELHDLIPGIDKLDKSPNMFIQREGIKLHIYMSSEVEKLLDYKVLHKSVKKLLAK